MNGFGVYVHWPFCLAKCPYCDFNSHVRHGGVDDEAFLAAYLTELDTMAELTGPREVTSIFFGGGTPSLMKPATVAAILERIGDNWRLDPEAEITLEANPTSVEAANFAQLEKAGVNRVSLGVQALEDKALAALGRQHSAREALAALSVARDHFVRVSIDLIYARPGQSPSEWREELGQALALGLDHFSLYQLTVEPETPFAALYARGKLAIPGEEQAAELYELTQELTGQAGLPAYEISNHAGPGNECRHNLTYWRSGDYAGVGPGAHSRLTLSGARRHQAMIKSPEAWRDQVMTQGHGLAEDQILEAREHAQEILLMGLRLAEGIALDRFTELGGEINAKGLAMMKQQGLVAMDKGWLRVSDEGRLVLNAVIAELIA